MAHAPLVRPGCAAFLAVVAVWTAWLPASHAAASRPNLVFVMADDLNSDYKESHLNIMPNLKAHWADRGLEFVNHVAAHPVCGPSRSSLLAGRYPHNTGYKVNGGRQSMALWSKEQNNTFGTWLSYAGYHTAFLGKYVNGMSGDVVSGFSRWGGFEGGIHTYNFYNASIYEQRFGGGAAHIPQGPTKVHNYLGVHQADFLGNITVDEARLAVEAGKPFAIHVTPTMVHWGTCYGPCAHGQGQSCYPPNDPHWEWKLPKWGSNGTQTLAMPCDPCPTRRHEHTFDALTAPHAPSWNQSSRGGESAFMDKHFPGLSAQQAYREDMCYRNRSSSAVDLDDMLGVIVDGLTQLGVMDETYLIFTSDNGFHLGEHRMPFGKGEPYTTDTSLPFYIAGPGVAQGEVRHHPTNHMDVTATILDLLGAQPLGPHPLDGKSFKGALAADNPTPVEDWRTWVYSEFFGANNTWQAVRTVNATALRGRDPRARGITTTMAVHRWCTNDTEVYAMAAAGQGPDFWQMDNVGAAGSATPFGAAAEAKYLPLLAAMGECSGADCLTPPLGGGTEGVPPLACYNDPKVSDPLEW